MAKKGNIRSIRFSDAMIEMIESQAGENFTAKFEALVTRCIWELPAREKELAEIRQRIENEKKTLRYIRDRKQRMENNLCNLEYITNSLIGQINRIVKEIEEV